MAQLFKGIKKKPTKTYYQVFKKSSQEPVKESGTKVPRLRPSTSSGLRPGSATGPSAGLASVVSRVKIRPPIPKGLPKVSFKEKILLLASVEFGPLPYKPMGNKGSFYTTVHRMIKTGELKKVKKKGEWVLIATSKGEAFLAREFPLFRFHRGSKTLSKGEVGWDGLLRLVSFEIEERLRRKRDALREELKKLGCGMLQRSLWVTPFDISRELRDFAGKEELEDKILFFEVGMPEKGISSLAAQVWPLENINEAYSVWRRDKNVDLFMSILKADPYLPKPLLPKGWAGGRALSEFRKLLAKYAD